MKPGGFDPPTRAVIIAREGGRCARCGKRPRTYHVHHRRPRGMGGDRRAATAKASNGLFLGDDCHDWIERNRLDAMILGYLVLAVLEPEQMPVLYQGGQFTEPTWVHLDDVGMVVALASDQAPDPEVLARLLRR